MWCFFVHSANIYIFGIKKYFFIYLPKIFFMDKKKRKLKPAKEKVKQVYGYVPAQYQSEAQAKVQAICKEYKLKLLQP